MFGLAACAGPGELDDSSEASTTLADNTPVVDCVEGIELGDCAPDFTLPDADGVDVSLSDYAGELILINCSAVW